MTPILRGFLSTPIDLEQLRRVRAPCLVLTHPGDALHPLRSGELLRQHLATCGLLAAPSPHHWRDGKRSADLAARRFGGQPIDGAI